MKALIVVDMQNDFLTGALANPEGVKAIPAVLREINKDYDVVIATKDTHFDESVKEFMPEGTMFYNDSLEGKNLPVPHCIKFTKGWEIDPVILSACKNAKEFHTIEKCTFGWDGWKNYLEKWRASDLFEKWKDLNEITLVGVCTDICVVSNALMLRAAFPNMKINVVANACAGVTIEKHNAALETMRSCQINVI